CLNSGKESVDETPFVFELCTPVLSDPFGRDGLACRCAGVGSTTKSRALLPTPDRLCRAVRQLSFAADFSRRDARHIRRRLAASSRGDSQDMAGFDGAVAAGDRAAET